MEEDWGDIDSVPTRKGVVPPWFWVCGTGCALALVVGIGAIAMGVRWIQKGSDPELQWPKVAELLPYDERSPSYELKFGYQQFGMEGFVFVEKEGEHFVMLMHFPEEAQAAEVHKEIVVTGAEGEDAEEIQLTIQGRELSATRSSQAGESPFPGGPKAKDGASILVDLTPAGETRPLVLMMVRQGSKEPITEAEVAQFLAPFRVGPDRGPPAAQGGPSEPEGETSEPKGESSERK